MIISLIVDQCDRNNKVSKARGVLGKMFGREAQHKLEKWTQSDLTGFKKRWSIGLEIGKKGFNWIEYQHINQIEHGCLRGLKMLKRAPNRIENLKNEGHHGGTSLPCPSMVVPPRGLRCGHTLTIVQHKRALQSCDVLFCVGD